MKVDWYPGTTKADAEQGYALVGQNGDSFFAKNSQSPENRGFKGRPQPMVSTWDGEYAKPWPSEYTED